MHYTLRFEEHESAPRKNMRQLTRTLRTGENM
jgi:hypothetical protein